MERKVPVARKYDITAEPLLKVLFYGKPGSTKTRTAATACLDPRTKPVLWLNAAGNPLSIRDYAEKPDIIDIEALKDVNDPYNWIVAGQDPNAPFAKKFELRPPYKTIVVDQITDVQRLSFATVMNEPNLGPGDMGKFTDRRDFYAVLGQMVRFSKLYYSLPINVIMTALEADSRDDQTGAITYEPLLWGQSATEVAGYAYVVARLVHRSVMSSTIAKVVEDAIGKEKVTSVALFLPSGKYVAKDQYGSLGSFMIDPSIGRMLDLILNRS